jgi:hypothetical protein
MHQGLLQNFECSCHCGATSLRLSALSQASINCHCGLCRRLSGAAFTTWVTARADDVALTGDHASRTYRPTENLERVFCAQCGTHIVTKHKRYPDIVGIPAGLLEGLDLPSPKGEYFVRDKAPWFQISSRLPCFGGETGFEEVAAT